MPRLRGIRPPWIPLLTSPVLLAIPGGDCPFFSASCWRRYWYRGCGQRTLRPSLANASEAVAGPTREHVSLTIDFGDGRTKDILDVVWSPGTTVADALSQVPALKVEKKGSGAGALLTSIDGVANQGADGKNWTFRSTANWRPQLCRVRVAGRGSCLVDVWTAAIELKSVHLHAWERLPMNADRQQNLKTFWYSFC